MKSIINKCNDCIDNKVFLNEMQTKTSIIIPFFKYLKYDVENYNIFKAEVQCGRERVDYAIFLNGYPDILIETKKLTENLDKHVSQICKYMKYHENSNIGILTNGNEYRFYIRNKDNKDKLIEKIRFTLSNLTIEDFNLINLLKEKSINVILNEYVMRPYYIASTFKNIFNSPNTEFLEFFSKISGIKDVSTDEIKDYFINIISKNDKIVLNEDKEKHLNNNSYYDERLFKILKKKGFSDKEIDLILIFKNQNDFDIYLSLRLCINNFPYTERNKNHSLTDIYNYSLNYYNKANNKKHQSSYLLLKNNKKLILGIIKKIIPETWYKYSYNDDVFTNSIITDIKEEMKAVVRTELKAV